MDSAHTTAAPAKRQIIGAMTGTSLDGLDLALVEIHGHGLDMTARCLHHAQYPLGPLAGDLAELAGGKAATPLELARVARKLGELHAQAIADFLGHHRHTSPCLVAAHGQTLWHAPAEHISVQLLDPWPIARRLSLPVVYDLRQADLAAGGQGAPITPLADWIFFRDPKEHRLAVNLGGICNVTYLPAGGLPESVRGEDIGPCNLLIDGVVRALFPDQPFDRDGRIAATGQAHPILGEWVMQSPFFSRPCPRTTGREDYPPGWAAELARKATPLMPPADVVASAVEVVAHRIIQSCPAGAKPLRIILAGGGAKNPVLVQRIADLTVDVGLVTTSPGMGVPVDAREAAEFAVLGALSQDGVSITLPGVTGADRPGRAGAWAYP
ncbi:MAG: anhydro-N-acetylmuramic acid kinase [Phycisphaeraceae bacterium]|nr:anhydro-N-acetylmuramic acid kinase [Phycisphaeraceae bacterium]